MEGLLHIVFREPINLVLRLWRNVSTGCLLKSRTSRFGLQIADKWNHGK